jgi:tight adherence protein B
MTTPTVAAGVLLVAALAGLFLFVRRPASAPESLQERWARHYGPATEGVPDSTEAQASRGAAFLHAISAYFARDQYSRRRSADTPLAHRLDQAELPLRPVEFLLLELGFGVLVAGLGVLRFNLPVGIALGIVFGAVGGEATLRIRHQRRLAKFDAQLPTILLSLANALRAGQGLVQALERVSANAAPPIGPDISRMLNEIRLGRLPDEALEAWAGRYDSEDLTIAVASMRVAMKVGSSLADILDTIAETISERVRIQGDVRVRTAQVRLSGWIVSLLPVALGIFLAFLEPSYFAPMIHSAPGFVLLAIGAAMLLIGIGLVRKVAQIRV